PDRSCRMNCTVSANRLCFGILHVSFRISMTGGWRTTRWRVRHSVLSRARIGPGPSGRFPPESSRKLGFRDHDALDLPEPDLFLDPLVGREEPVESQSRHLVFAGVRIEEDEAAGMRSGDADRMACLVELEGDVIGRIGLEPERDQVAEPPVASLLPGADAFRRQDQERGPVVALLAQLLVLDMVTHAN